MAKSFGSYKVLVLLTAIVVATLALGLAVKADAQEAGAAPTIQSDQSDYPPGGTVVLTGSGWQPGESVNIVVNDEAGQTWSRNVDVSADENGEIRDEFQLPDWFVAQYSVRATGAQSGEATASFTDAGSLEGKDNVANAAYRSGGPLEGWKELDKVPMRLVFTSAGSKTVTVNFDHNNQSGRRIPGIRDLVDWSKNGQINSFNAQLTDTSGTIWAYTVTASVANGTSNANKGFVFFNAHLAAGSHAYPGGSMQINLDGDLNDTMGIKPSDVLAARPDLVVDKTGPATAAPGSTIEYRLDYKNVSTTDGATGVALTDVLPSDANGNPLVTFVDCSNNCTVQGNEVVWTLGNLAPGAGTNSSLSQTLRVKIPQNATNSTPPFVNNANILSADNEQDLASCTGVDSDDNADNDNASCDNYDSLKTSVAANNAPNAVNDSLTTSEDNAGSVNVLANDTDPDGDTLSVTGKSNGTNGTATVNQDGTITYTPDANFSGTDTFTYTVSDGKATATGTVNVTVNPVNDKPVISSVAVDGGAVDEGSPATVRVTATDPDNGAGDLRYSFDCDNDNVFEKGPQAADNDTCTFPDDGTYRVNVKVEDGAGGSETSFTNVVVNNVAPEATLNAPNSVDENSPVGISLSNVTDPGSLDTFEYRFQCGDGTWTAYGQSDTHTCQAPDDGQLVVKGQVRDDDGGESPVYQKTVTVNNVGPEAKDLTGENDRVTTPEDTPKNITLEATNPGNDQLTFSIVTGPSNGDLSGNGANLTYTPDPDYNGSDSFTFRVCDDDEPQQCDEGQIDINVTPVNDDPEASNDSYTASEDQPLTVNAADGVLANDGDPDGDTLEVVDFTQPGNGTVALNPDGSFTYTPGANFNGEDTFTYTVSDGTANGTATVRVTVNAVNDNPVAADDTANVNEDDAGGVLIDVLANDSAGPGNESGQSLHIDSITSNPGKGGAQITAGQVLYVPNLNEVGSDSFEYRVCDDGSPSECATATVNVAISALNDDPTAEDDSYTTDEDQALTVNAAEGVLANDGDPDAGDNLTASVKSGPANGTLNLNPDGSFTYTPNPNFNGTDTFTYTVSDGNGGAADGVVTVTIRSVDDGPEAKDLTGENDRVTTPEDTPKNITLEATDADSSNLSFEVVNGPNNGTLSGSGANLTYTPDPDYNGTDAFAFRVCDDSTPQPLCDTADVHILVTPVNDDPVAEDDTASVDEDNPVNIDVLANDTDPDGAAAQNLDPSSVAVVDAPQNGTATVNPDGTITYTPNANFNGTDTFTYEVCDNDAACSNPATVTVTIRSVNDDPIVNVTGVQDGASYEEGQVPDPGCEVGDVEDGNQSVNPTLSNITGPLAQHGLGQQTVTCSYTDQDGKTVTSEATYTIQDTTRPMVEWVKRLDVGNKSSKAHGKPHARATFTEDMDPSTINGLTVTLVKQSTGKQVGAKIRYDAAKRKAILVTNRKLVLGAKYIATVKGGASGVTDVAGNLLDPDGDEVWVFTVRKANR